MEMVDAKDYYLWIRTQTPNALIVFPNSPFYHKLKEEINDTNVCIKGEENRGTDAVVLQAILNANKKK